VGGSESVTSPIGGSRNVARGGPGTVDLWRRGHPIPFDGVLRNQAPALLRKDSMAVFGVSSQVTSAEIDSFLKDREIRMIGRRLQAKSLADCLQPAESLVDVVKASFILVDGKRMSKTAGFALVILTNGRLIILWGGQFPLDLTTMSGLSELHKGRFKWRTEDGHEYQFVHATGIIHWNGNKVPTERFYASLKSALDQRTHGIG
jgi:hypothetical protein